MHQKQSCHHNIIGWTHTNLSKCIALERLINNLHCFKRSPPSSSSSGAESIKSANRCVCVYVCACVCVCVCWCSMVTRKGKENRLPSLNGEDFQPAKKNIETIPEPSLIDEAMMNIAKGPMVANTKKSTDWGIRVFCEWCRQRNASQPKKCPSNLLVSHSAEPLNYWLSRFDVEAWRADGDRYPSSNMAGGSAEVCVLAVQECPHFLDK